MDSLLPGETEPFAGTGGTGPNGGTYSSHRITGGSF